MSGDDAAAAGHDAAGATRAEGDPLAQGGRSRVAAAPAVRLRLLALPSVLRDTEPPVVLERRDAALLALLAFEGATPRAHAAALIWPEVDAERARTNLRQRLFRLRRQLGFDLAGGNDTLHLDQRVVTELGDLEARIAADPDALAGALLGDFVYDDGPDLARWVRAVRGRWGERRARALRGAADTHAAAGRVAMALRYVERLLADDVLDEDAWRRLIGLHRARGDGAAARAAYARCRATLSAQLRRMPAAETQALAAQLEANEVEPGNAAPRPATLLRPPRLIGRATAWAELDRAWHAGRTCFVLGEPGVGKTRLMSDFALVQPGVVRSGARPGDADVAYTLTTRVARLLLEVASAPLEEWVRAELGRLLPELGKPAEGTFVPVRLLRALGRVLAHACEAGVSALVVDDLQFADAASLEAITALIVSEDGQKVRWLLGARSNELPDHLMQWLASGDGLAVAQIRLEPLAAADVGQLIASLALAGIDAAALAPVLHRQTGGNPLFILEVLREAAGPAAGDRPPVPQTVGALIAARLQQLSAPALVLAQVAALAGQQFSAELAAAVLHAHPLDLAPAWHELELAQVLREQVFAHDLVFEATLRVVPAARAPALHREIAEFLALQAAAPALLAPHWRAAGELERAARAYADAAAAARQVVRRSEAAQLENACAECWAALGRTAALAESLGLLCFDFYNLSRVGDIWQTIERLEALPQTAQRTVYLAARVRSWVTHDRTPGPESARLMGEVRRLAAEVGDDFEKAHALAWEIGALGQANRHAEAIALSREWVPMFEALPARDLGGVLFFRATGLAFETAGRYQEGLAHLERAERGAREHGDTSLIGQVQGARALCHFHLGQLDAAARAMQSARAALTEESGRAQANPYDTYLVRFWRDQGRYNDVLALAAQSLPLMLKTANANWVAGLEFETARTLLVLGQVAPALRHLPPADGLPPYVRFAALIIEAEATRAQRRPVEDLLRRAVALAPTCERPHLCRWRAAIELSRVAGAHEAVELTRAAAAESLAAEAWSAAGPSQAMLVDALRRAGHVDEAACEADRLLELLRTHEPVTLYPPEYAWIAFQALDAAGFHDRAVAALRTGVDWIELRALPNVAAGFKDSFVHRNPINRSILTTASRRLR